MKNLEYTLIWETFGPFKRSAVMVFFLILGGAIFETLGVGMVLPLLDAAVSRSADHDRDSPIAWALQNVSVEDQLLVVSVVTLVVMFLKAIFLICQAYFSSQFVNNLRQYWCVRFIKHYLYSDYRDIHRLKRGELINNMIHEPTYASKALRELLDLIASSVMCLFLVAMLLVVSWKMTVVIGLVCGVILSLFLLVTGKYSFNVGLKKIKLNQQISQVAVEAISGVRQLKIFSGERMAIAQLDKPLAELMHLLNRFAVARRVPAVSAELLVITFLVSFVLVYRYVYGGDVLTVVPVIGLFAVSSMRIFSSISKVIAQRMSIKSYWPSIKVVHDMCSARSVVDENVDESRSIEIANSVRMEDVVYDFNPTTRLFSGLSMEFRKGHVTAIVAGSGFGKSTICDLLVRLHRPSAGRILVDNTDLQDVDESRWRRSVGYVSQEPYIFNVSVRENILMGSPSATDAELNRAVEFAAGQEFVEELPDGYETLIGERGVALSGGQRQRVAIARAFIRDPQLLIFDEATNSLDGETEHRVLSVLKSFAVKKTVILITHKMSMLSFADYIYFCGAGRVIESGTYHALREKQGEFWRYVTLSEKGRTQEASFAEVE